MSNPLIVEFLLEQGATEQTVLEPTHFLEVTNMGPTGNPGVYVTTIGSDDPAIANLPPGTLVVQVNS